MLTLIIYDTTGFIINQMQGSSLREPIGIPFLNVEIPEGKYIIGVDVTVTPNIPIYTDIPKTEMEILQADQLLQSERLAQKEIDDLEFQEYVLSQLPQ